MKTKNLNLFFFGLPIINGKLSPDGGGLTAKSCLTLGIPWTVARQAPLSMGFPRQEYWSGWPFPSPGDLPNPGIEPESPALQADSLQSELPEAVYIYLLFFGFPSHLGHHRVSSSVPCAIK